MSTDQILQRNTLYGQKLFPFLDPEIWNTLRDSHLHITPHKETAVGLLPRLNSIHNRKVEVAKKLESNYSLLIP